MSTAQRPVPGAARPYHFPVIERATLANGLRIVVASMPRLPLVTVLALTDAGAVGDPAGAEGTASLTARTLPEGIAGLNGAAITERFEALGTAVESWADWDSSVMRCTVVPHRLDPAFTLFAEVLCAPTFPAPDVARRRDERLAALTQRLTEPGALADQRFAGFLYAGASHVARYARAAGGTLFTVPALDDIAVRRFHAARYAPSSTTLIFVGDVTLSAATRLAESTLGSWRASTPQTPSHLVPSPAPPPAREGRAAIGARRVVIVAKEEAPQSEVRVGHVGVPRSHPDHLAIVVMNALLGGLFSSRINLNLRERHAFTYGASSGFDWRRGPGPFVVSTAVKSEVTDRAVEEILREIDLMRAAAPDASELALATDYLAGVFPIRYETTDAVAGALAAATTFGLPDDWFSSYRDRVQAIREVDVLSAARAHLDPTRLLVLAVGDAALIRGPLERLAIAPVRVVTPAHDPTEVQ